jgi:S1/P1 Nuclease
MLAHLVGDLHQPLHSGNAFVSASGPLRFVLPDGPTGWRTTTGGNALVYGPQDRFNLHSYWDSHIVNLAMRNDDVPTFAVRLKGEVPQTFEWRDTGDPDRWPERWLNETLVYAKDAYRDIKLTLYLGADESARIPHRWRIEQPRNYDERSRERVRIQLAKGGYRLAALLIAIYGQ